MKLNNNQAIILNFALLIQELECPEQNSKN